MAIVEVGMMGVQPDKTPMDASTPDGKILLDAWRSVTTLPGGPQAVYWGLSVEQPNELWAWFDWHSLEEHEAFAKRHGGDATKRFGEVFTPGFTKHVYINTSVLKSPVTEVMLAFFPPDISNAHQDRIAQQFALFQTKALDKCSDVRGVSAGWGLEHDFSVRGSDSSQKGRLFIALIGWGTIDEHMAFRDTDEFKDNVDVLRNLEGCIKLGMFHVKCSVLARPDEATGTS